MLFIVANLTQIKEHVTLVCVQFYVQTGFVQFLAVSNVLQARDVIAEDAELVSVSVQTETFPQALPCQRSLVALSRFH